MNTHPAAIWSAKPDGLRERLRRTLGEGLSECRSASPGIFFRADDIGVPGKGFARLMALFMRFHTPLALAVVPAWLTPERWRAVRATGGEEGGLWCWHQHGWRHVSHAESGKKQEFDDRLGPGRIARDIHLGKARLQEVMGEDFFPGFTPPWNRCGAETLACLREAGFLFVSRSAGALPPSPPDLPDFAVNVDLHTRKEAVPEEGWENLLSEIRRGVASGACGVMIHHQRMNDAAYDFLELLLGTAAFFPEIARVHLGRLAGAGENAYR